MSKVLFANPAIIGVVLLPTMLYHAYQLIIVSIIAKKLGKNGE
jgi:sodium/bile acid cotransporter 7